MDPSQYRDAIYRPGVSLICRNIAMPFVDLESRMMINSLYRLAGWEGGTSFGAMTPALPALRFHCAESWIAPCQKSAMFKYQISKDEMI